jgi:hypothetical protein
MQPEPTARGAPASKTGRGEDPDAHVARRQTEQHRRHRQNALGWQDQTVGDSVTTKIPGELSTSEIKNATSHVEIITVTRWPPKPGALRGRGRFTGPYDVVLTPTEGAPVRNRSPPREEDFQG